MKIGAKVGLILLGVATALAVAVPPVYSIVLKAQAKSHIVAGCEVFGVDGIGLNPENAVEFTREFSLAALKDPAYIPIAKAGAWMNVGASVALQNNLFPEFRDALTAIEGLCWGVND